MNNNIIQHQSDMGFFGKTVSDPLFSTIITFCTLILLYFPNHFLLVVFSPILISTSFLLLSLLRLGAIQRSNQPPTTTVLTNSNALLLSESSEELIPTNNSTLQLSTAHHQHDQIIDHQAWVRSESSEAAASECDSVYACPTKSFYPRDSFVEWDLRAPLEVIYEEYEGDSEGEGQGQCEEEEGKREVQMTIIERYASLSKFYPETDSDISSSEEEGEDLLTIRDWDSPERVCFQWEGDEKEGMIEIELGRTTKKYHEDEEENLIEIELYPVSFPAGKE